MEFYTKSIQQTFEETNSRSTGLTNEDAKQRLEQNGANVIAAAKPKSTLKIILSNLAEPMVYILGVAILITIISKHYTDSAIIFVVILLNVIIGTVQEKKAISSLESLKSLVQPKAQVRRDGKILEINASDVVVGDVLILEAGMIIGADARLISVSNFQVIESALTGESLPVNKKADEVYNDVETVLGDRKNMVYMSTLVSNGRAEAVVVATANDTEIGLIATLLTETKSEMTPLQKRLHELTKVLAIISIVVVILMVIVGIIQGREFADLALTALSLAIAALPEGLPAVVTIVLALGTQRMVAKHAVVKTLPAVETLGAVSVICSDKTGTLTQNKMTVQEIYYNQKVHKADDINAAFNEFKYGLILCNDAILEEDKVIGDPTELALVSLQSYVQDKLELEAMYPRVSDLPFDSSRKMMTTCHQFDKVVSFTKGAPDIIIGLCNKVMINGEIQEFNAHDEVMQQVSTFSKKGLRVLALAYSEKEITEEKDLIFLGLVTMIDPPRLEVKSAIVETKKAGIITVMITGDFKDTAFAIAKELGIADDEKQCLSGTDLTHLTDEELKDLVVNIRVFARVSPKDKVRIVEAFKANGHIVSMTGDGVNDAPSLKKADIGVAMGITGTEVSKDAADIVLLDDNFTTIVSAVEEGRNIYKNIKKVVLFLVSCNFGEIIAVFGSILLGVAAPLAAVQILWVNLITDTLPALSLGVDKTNENLMLEKPRKAKESIFSGGNLFLIIANGTFIGLLTLGVFMYFDKTHDLSYARTMAFSVLGLSQLMYSLSIRSTVTSIFKLNAFTNKYLIGSIVIAFVLQLAVIEVNFLNNVFYTVPVSYLHLLVILGLSISAIIFSEITKFVNSKFTR